MYIPIPMQKSLFEEKLGLLQLQSPVNFWTYRQTATAPTVEPSESYIDFGYDKLLTFDSLLKNVLSAVILLKKQNRLVTIPLN